MLTTRPPPRLITFFTCNLSLHRFALWSNHLSMDCETLHSGSISSKVVKPDFPVGEFFSIVLSLLLSL